MAQFGFVRAFLVFIGLIFSFSSAVQAQIYNGTTLKPAPLSDLVNSIKPGSVVIIGEMHGLQPVHDQQMEILNAIKATGLNVSVGMEFFNYTDQSIITDYRAGVIDEAAFLKAISWGGFEFGLYRDQLLFGEMGLGINLTRDVTKVISKQGLAALTPEQNKLLPPNFTIGRDSYRQRFFQAMGHPVPVASLENYFVAQSAWDDTMAWQTVQFQKQHPDHVFVIIVGEFHVQYGGGLPNRIKARLAQENLPENIVTVSQVYTDGMTEQDIQDSLQSSVEEGPRADFIMLSK